MALFDLPLAELERYAPEVQEPADFDEFWIRTLRELGQLPADVEAMDAHPELRALHVQDVSFTGWGGARIRAWFVRPRGLEGPLPGVVHYLGYSSGRGFPTDRLAYAAAGFATLVMDTRGQGSVNYPGGTGDPEGSSEAGHHKGFLTRGLPDAEQYYYRRVFADAHRAVDVLKGLPGVDPSRVGVVGVSQGGGIAQAVSGLRDDLAFAGVDVPFLSHFARAIQIADREPYSELLEWLAVYRDREEEAFTALSYFDGVNFAARGTAPALYSVALRDRICPPSTVFAAYNRRPGVKAIEVYPYNGHEGGASAHLIRQLAWLREVVG